MIKCKICVQPCKSIGSLSKHIRDNHGEYSSQKYYDEFLRITPAGICVICSSPTKFVNLGKGYNDCCSHTCSGTWHRKKLAADKQKHELFTKKVSTNQTNIWKDRRQTGVDKEINAKTGNTIRQNNSILTKEQLNAKYGWLNNLSDNERTHWIETVMKKTGAHNWWKKASESDKQEVITRRNATKLGITLIEYDNQYTNPEDYKTYYWWVWVLTERTYKKHKNAIDPESLRSPSHHLDHKFSIIRGYHLQINPDIVASIHNLEMLSASNNSRKGGKCSLDIELLKELYRG